MKKYLLPILILIAGALGTYALVQAKKPAEKRAIVTKPLAVKVITVEPQTVQYHVNSQGRIRAKTEATLVAEVSGTVKYIHSDFVVGGNFKKDEILITLDSRDYDLAVIRAQAQVAAAEQLFSRTSAEAQQAKFDWEKLGKKGSPTPLVLKKPQLAEALARLKGAKADFEIARLSRQRVDIRAPFDGRIKTKLVDIGHFVRIAEPVADVYSTPATQVRLPLHDEQLRFLPAGILDGELAEVTLAAEFAGESLSWQATISRSEGLIDTRTRLVTLVAELKPLSPTQPHPQIGQFVKASILGRTVSNVFVIPTTALREKNEVLLADPDNKLRIQSVDVLRKESNRVIISSGLSQGQRVITSPLEIVIDAMQLQVIPSDITAKKAK